MYNCLVEVELVVQNDVEAILSKEVNNPQESR